MKILQAIAEHQLRPCHDTPQTYSFPQALPIQNKREKKEKEKERGEERREEGKEGRKVGEGRGRVRRYDTWKP